ncbi:MAG: hypothetical protein KC503_40170 [Myxococcales bacterium]|nr:hypothetical protein [Myxococcales bacterium]
MSRRRFARSAARRGPVRQARDDESPPSYDINAGNRLAITARFASGTIEVRRRGGQRFTLQDSGQLRLRDKLVTRAGAQLTLLLPGHQWVVLRGAARLLSIPRRGASSGKVHIALLRGVIRARGNQRGGGVTIHQGRRRVHTASGEMRLRLRAGGALAVSSIDATVDVSGPHAPRVVSAGSGLVLDQRPGFAHALLSAPTSLRPVVFRGPRAPRLRWKTVASARRYRVLVGRDADFFQIVERADITSTSYTPRLSGLSGKFYWKVIALGEAKRGAPSKIYGFRIEKNDD